MDIYVIFGLGLLYKASKGILIHDFGIRCESISVGCVPRARVLGEDAFLHSSFQHTLTPAMYSSLICVTTLPVFGIIIKSC